ncbi:hypothetical protein RQM47_16355 [Rubrivirga sp. S365]|uniref:hypothetical protein n=1 Tax=Rubrivirga sp. S365 TaxID=3076080 RepID=UPI0028C7A990|nr:hypothetical protein [Rubrivirga sp. S365]MDT7858222.1 hypothetical protein [Rubrivirga sp. S365]
MSKSPKFTMTLTAEEERTLLHGTEAERLTFYRLKRSQEPDEDPGDEAMRASLYVGLVVLCVGLVTVLALASSVTVTADDRVAFGVSPAVVVAAAAFYLGVVWSSTLVLLKTRRRGRTE